MIKKFEQFKVNEGINTEALNDEQRAALKEVQESDLTALDDRDMQHYADKIGVSLEDLAGYLADAGMPNTSDDESSLEEDEAEAFDEEIKEIVQRELVDNPEVDNGNLIMKIDELVDRLEEDDYYEWDLEEDWDDYLGKYQTLKDVIKNAYNELTGVNNPDQLKMEFESIKRFGDFIKEDSDLAVGSVGERKFKVTGYRTWDEARPEGVVEADNKEEVEDNFKAFEDVLKKQDPAFEGADLESIEEIPNNL
jgi:hypothetical protein